MSVMWNPEVALRTARPAADAAVASVDRRLRAQIWAGLLSLNFAAWAIGVWLVGSAVL